MNVHVWKKSEWCSGFLIAYSEFFRVDLFYEYTLGTFPKHSKIPLTAKRITFIVFFLQINVK